MAKKTPFRKTPTVSASHTALTLTTVLIALLILLPPAIVHAQTKGQDVYTITLKSRSITPKPGIDPKLEKELANAIQRGETRHLYIQLIKHLNMDQRADLEKQGIKLLSYIGSYTWRAVLQDRKALSFTSEAVRQRSPILGAIRWIGAIQPQDRVNPQLLTEGVSPHSRKEGVVYLIVTFHKDVALSNARHLVETAGGTVLGEVKILNSLQISGPEPHLHKLIELDAVQWVDELPPKGEDDNDGLRGAINVDVVQAAPYNLDGTDVSVGQWESGNADDTHPDFGARVTVGDAATTISDHATHVAGILLGDGGLSATDGGAANQWRGVAPNASDISFRRRKIADALDIATTTAQYTTALGAPTNIALSTNSWGTGHYHDGDDYDAGCQLYDQLIRPDEGRGITIIASAGNQGPANSGVDWTTVRIPNSAKNTIVVGSVFSDTGGIVGSSSRGPTDDGRIKPDVVAPGDEVGGDNSIRSTIPNEYIDIRAADCAPGVLPAGTPNTDDDDFCYPYDLMSGTSMATPAVSGVAALMIQQYRTTYFGATNNTEVPLPSSIKSILVHTADDVTADATYNPGVNFAGPDYFSGYGQVDAQAAIDAISNARFREGVIHSADDEDIYTFDIGAGEDELKVTLAWDDVAAAPGDALVDILKNDLDLVVINPDNDEFFPPWEMDPTKPDTPAARNSYASEALADGHRDEVNVVEQVVIDNPEAGTWKIKIKANDLPDPNQRYSIIAGDQPNDQLRGQVDIMQVLDRSGSMGGYASMGSAETKIQTLRNAADQFVQMMTPDIGNQLGLVQFNADVVPFAAALDADLSELTTARVDTLRDDTIPSIVEGGRTSIGDGLHEAMTQLTSATAEPDNDKIILLVTDGKENEPRSIADVQTDLTDNDIAVYPIGLGYGSGINEDKLTSLAEATGGTYRITSDELIFRKFFIEVLAGAVDWDVVVDPVGSLSAGESIEIPVTLTPDQEGANFTVYWEGVDQGIDLTLITPNDIVITPATANTRMRYGDHERYAFYQLTFPLDASLAAERAGVWRMKISANSPAVASQSVRYSASAFSSGGAELEAKFDTLAQLTGNRVFAQAQLTKNKQPLPGAQVNLDCNVPSVSAGNVLHQPIADFTIRTKTATVNGDPVSLVDKKLKLLNQQAGSDVLIREKATLQLFDDGEHEDGNSNDGVYANRFPPLQKSGSYTCRFVVSGIPAGDGMTTTREWTKSFYTEVNIDPDYSVLDIVAIKRTEDGIHYAITIAPMDRYGNYLGPGRSIAATVKVGNVSRPVALIDNIDGTYTGNMTLSENQVASGAKLEVIVADKPFAPSVPVPLHQQWYIGAHIGSAIPTGSFSNSYDASYGLGLQLGYRLTSNISLVGSLNYDDFDSKVSSVNDIAWRSLSFNARYEFIPGSLRPYLTAGVGVYEPTSGSTENGVNFGAGVDYWFDYNWGVSAGVDYHTVFTSGGNTEFLVPFAGLNYQF